MAGESALDVPAAKPDHPPVAEIRRAWIAITEGPGPVPPTMEIAERIAAQFPTLSTWHVLHLMASNAT